MRLTGTHIAILVLVGIIVGYYFGQRRTTITLKKEGFLGFELGTTGALATPRCGQCGGGFPCSGCQASRAVCPPCREPDMSKYVLKTSVPPCPTCPDMSQYMLKTECPPSPDLSRYVLKSSIPKPQPIIIDNTKCRECPDCPPCPRPRCPEVRCPAPTKCPPPAPCPRPVCPPQVVKCRAEQSSPDPVRPFLAPLNWNTFGTA